jgi:hypothetical protein
MLQLYGPAAEKPEVVKSCFFYLKKAMPILRKMPKTALF